MKKTLYVITSLLIAFSGMQACQNDKQENHDKTQLEKNRENYKHEQGDHVLKSEDLKVLTPEEKQAYIKKSKEIAGTAFKIFSSHLNTYFKAGEPVKAIEYCHDNAMRITDSLSKVYGVRIKRTSFRIRNPKNRPTDQEEKVLEIFKERIHKNLKPQPYMHYDEDGNPHVYLPIMMQDKCLMCHGDPNKEIPEAINQKLAELYPNDKAIFFKKGDLRGIWSITFPKNK